MDISQEDELLTLMKDGGCGAILIGFRNLVEARTSKMHKGINQRYNYAEAVSKIQSHGILVQSSFILGYDYDSQETFDHLIDFVQETKLLMPLIQYSDTLSRNRPVQAFRRRGDGT